MNKYRRLLSNSIIFALGNLTVKAAQFFILPLLTKYLLESQYGLTENMVVTIQDLITPILTLGLAEALFRFSVDKKNSPEEIISNSMIVVFIGIGIFVIGDLLFYMIAHFQGSQYGDAYLLLLIPLFAFKAIKNLLAEFTRGIGKTIIYALSSIIESIVMLSLAAILIIFANLGIYGYLIALIAAPITGIVFLSISVNPLRYLNIKSFSKNKLREMLKYSVPNVSNSVCWWIVQTSSRYLVVYLSVWTIGGFTNNTALMEEAWALAGIYTAASKLPSLINVVSSIFLQAWSLSSSQEVESEDKNVFYNNVFKYYMPVVMLATSVLFLILPYVSKLLLKGNFYDGWVYSPMLIMGAVSGCFSAFFGAFFGAYFKTKYSMISTFIGAGINLALCFIGIPIVAKFAGMDYTVYMAAFAFWMSYNVIVITRIAFAKKLVDLEINWFKYIIQYVLNSILAVLYTINILWKWVACVIVILVTLLLNIKEIIYIISKINKYVTRKIRNMDFKFKILSLLNRILIKNNKKIVFYGRSKYDSNNHALIKYMINQNYNKKYKIYLVVNNDDDLSFYDKIKNLKSVKGALAGAWHTLTAKYVFHCYGMGRMKSIIPKSQIVFDLWHGIGIKALPIVADGKKYSSTSTYILATCDYGKEYFKKCFGYNEEQFYIGGYPRCDALLSNNDTMSKFGINKTNYEKVVIYMPTFRKAPQFRYDDSNIEFPLFNKETFIEFDNYLQKKNVLFIIKPHPAQDSLELLNNLNEKNIKVIKNKDLLEKKTLLYEFVENADILLTDYSSISFDFLRTQKPMGFVIDDIDIYSDKRGFVVDNPMDYMPGEKIKDISGLINFLDDILSGKDEWKEERRKVNDWVNFDKSGDYCKKILDFLQIKKDN